MASLEQMEARVRESERLRKYYRENRPIPVPDTSFIRRMGTWLKWFFLLNLSLMFTSYEAWDENCYMFWSHVGALPGFVRGRPSATEDQRAPLLACLACGGAHETEQCDDPPSGIGDDGS